ncbi:MarR family transcriptional regulator [Paraburkholderia sp. J7]|uniref:MarR family winged helix-turn-helix transcriptional regulator n=1 Tax=Paraburkholderia sp. J7 TaxID=2805438 RepID=UPI002AB630C9|nr:MarR family transcriptional regulator [Paraburkholderia sp. J7]
MRSKDQPLATPARLSESLCFTIYSANLAFGKVYRPILDELGLTYPQYITIVALWEASPQTVGDLGEKLFLETNTLTPILKRLQLMGYLERQRDPKDERRVLVSLTRSGRQLRERALSKDLVKATGLEPGAFAEVQKAISKLRMNLNRPSQLRLAEPD